MTEGSSTTAQDLDALCRQAGQRAAAWQLLSAAQSSAAQPEGSHRQGLLKWALVAGPCALAVAVLAAQLQGEAASAGPPEALAAAAQRPLSEPPLLSPEAPVRWVGNELAMDLDAVPLQQAARWLAQATHSTVAGVETLKPVAVTLQFRGQDTAAAWRQLLQGHATVALACDASDCRVWISGETPAPAATPAHPRADGLQPKARPADLAPGETESQPDGSC